MLAARYFCQRAGCLLWNVEHKDHVLFLTPGVWCQKNTLHLCRRACASSDFICKCPATPGESCKVQVGMTASFVNTTGFPGIMFECSALFGRGRTYLVSDKAMRRLSVYVIFKATGYHRASNLLQIECFKDIHVVLLNKSKLCGIQLH